MTLIHWREHMSVGVEELDADHKALIDLLNRLHFMVLAGDDELALGRVIGELVDYVTQHFHREERLMEEAGYPELAVHRKAHEAFELRLGEFENAFLKDPKHFNEAELYDFLADWLVVHVTEEDKAYAPYVARRAKQPA